MNPIPSDSKNVPASTNYAFVVDEKGLFDTLSNGRLCKSVRIMTLLVNIFPYIKPFAKKFISLTRIYREDKSPIISDDKFEGYHLTLLAIHFFGPAYSRSENLHLQITKRMNAALGRKYKVPTPEQVKTVLESISWNVGIITPVVYELLGMVLCIKPDGTYDAEATIDELEKESVMKEKYEMSGIAYDLLSYARMIYKYKRVTTIRFVLSVADLIKNIAELKDTFGHELTEFEKIEKTLQNSPYIGLRAVIPKEYHIKNFTKLVYCGLLYHEKYFTNEAEKKFLRDGKIANIITYIPTVEMRLFIEQIAKDLPTPQVCAIASIVQFLSLYKANNIMSTKPKHIQNAVLNLLRNKQNKGSWAEEKIEIEKTTYWKETLQKFNDDVTAILETKLLYLKAKLNKIYNIEEYQTADKTLDIWRQCIIKSLKRVEELKNVLSHQFPEIQNWIRSDIKCKLQDIITILNNEPNLVSTKTKHVLMKPSDWLA